MEGSAQTRKRRSYCDHEIKQNQCTQTQTRPEYSPNTFPRIYDTSPVFLHVLLLCLLLFSSICASVHSIKNNGRENPGSANQTFGPEEELKKLKILRAHLKNINKAATKSIQSPDGDVIDCVNSHEQIAFDHPLLKGHKPLDPPERPKGYEESGMEFQTEGPQLWSLSGESCPEGTIPVRRTTEEDMLRASSLQRFGRLLRRQVRRDSTTKGHEHAVGYASGSEYYGAKASINVWAPGVANQNEFSLSQMWLISGSFNGDLNTIEAGWQLLFFRLVHNCTETAERDFSRTGRRMHIKRPDVTIYFAPALSRRTIELQSELLSLLFLLTGVDNLTSAF